MKWFGLIFIIAVLVGWLTAQRILDCLFSFGCDSTSIIGVLAFIVFWPAIVMINLAESLPSGLANSLGYAWLVVPVAAEFIYLYVIACLADKFFKRVGNAGVNK